MSKPKFEVREEWLQEALAICRDYMKGKGWTLPACHISVGWPSARGVSTKSPTIGQCWDGKCSDDKLPHIFISPTLKDPNGTNGILATVLHEATHAAVGCKCGHRGAFKECAVSLGFTAPMKTTPATPELLDIIKEWAEGLGTYPHPQLKVSRNPDVKKQTTRLGKFSCETCGYIARTTRKWLESVGAPHCPKHGEMKGEEPNE